MRKKFLGKNWFFEDFLEEDLGALEWGFRIDKELFSGKSKFQNIEVFENKELGRVLVLDGMVQFATKSESIYHEMLVHPAMFFHSKPEKILIIGGGDGPALREVLKHSTTKEVFLVDIDKKVTEISKKYFSSILKNCFNDKRVKIFHEDALIFVEKHKKCFDVVVEDLTDPTPVAKFCWNKGFYKDIFCSLRDGGVASFQSGQLREVFAKKARRDLSKVFPFFEVQKVFVPCFPFDEHTFSLGSDEIDFKRIDFKKLGEKIEKSKINLKYYSPEIHCSSFVIPKT